MAKDEKQQGNVLRLDDAYQAPAAGTSAISLVQFADGIVGTTVGDDDEGRRSADKRGLRMVRRGAKLPDGRKVILNEDELRDNGAERGHYLTLGGDLLVVETEAHHKARMAARDAMLAKRNSDLTSPAKTKSDLQAAAPGVVVGKVTTIFRPEADEEAAAEQRRMAIEAGAEAPLDLSDEGGE